MTILVQIQAKILAKIPCITPYKSYYRYHLQYEGDEILATNFNTQSGEDLLTEGEIVEVVGLTKNYRGKKIINIKKINRIIL